MADNKKCLFTTDAALLKQHGCCNGVKVTIRDSHTNANGVRRVAVEFPNGSRSFVNEEDLVDTGCVIFRVGEHVANKKKVVCDGKTVLARRTWMITCINYQLVDGEWDLQNPILTCQLLNEVGVVRRFKVSEVTLH